MIKLIEHEHELDRDLLNKTLSGKKMLAYMRAYGPNYEFCRFYKLTDENGIGFMFIINSTLIICTDGMLQPNEEINLFVSMNLPFRIEGDRHILEGIDLEEHYQKLNRTIFELIPDDSPLETIEEHVDFNPKLTDVYNILSEGFPNIADFSLWYTDTSHRTRHGRWLQTFPPVAEAMQGNSSNGLPNSSTGLEREHISSLLMYVSASIRRSASR